MKTANEDIIACAKRIADLTKFDHEIDTAQQHLKRLTEARAAAVAEVEARKAAIAAGKPYVPPVVPPVADVVKTIPSAPPVPPPAK